MTAQHQFSSEELDAWFQPIRLPAEPYREFAARLDEALEQLVEQHAQCLAVARQEFAPDIKPR